MDTHQEGIREGSKVLLTFKGQNIGLLEVESKWAPNKVRGKSGPERALILLSGLARGPFTVERAEERGGGAKRCGRLSRLSLVCSRHLRLVNPHPLRSHTVQSNVFSHRRKPCFLTPSKVLRYLTVESLAFSHRRMPCVFMPLKALRSHTVESHCFQVKEAHLCYKTASLEHPGVKMVAWERGQYYIGGKLHGLEVPTREFPCATPLEVGTSHRSQRAMRHARVTSAGRPRVHARMHTGHGCMSLRCMHARMHTGHGCMGLRCMHARMHTGHGAWVHEPPVHACMHAHRA
eukprot:360419-Chlamydomonas_euryale.AAC.3